MRDGRKVAEKAAHDTNEHELLLLAGGKDSTNPQQTPQGQTIGA
jgi:ribose transport system ATP-binding protein